MFAVLAIGNLAGAADLPGVNLGFTTFLDGGPPAGPGIYASQYFQYYLGDKFTDANGDKVYIPTAGGRVAPELDVFVSLTQLIYMSPNKPVLDAYWGWTVLLPYVHFDLGPRDVPLRVNSGFGDSVWGLFLQWDPLMGPNGPRFMHRFEVDVFLPTGEYDDDREINAGSNLIALNPQWAASLFLTPRWSISSRLHYLWNGENDNPSKLLFPGIDRIQPGQAFHANFTTEYCVIENRLRLGINGYYLKQFTDTRFDGREVPGRQEQVIGAGPGFAYHFSADTHLLGNLYFETGAENRTQGTRFNVRFLHHF